jgi:predicted nucleic acid-binding protein
LINRVIINSSPLIVLFKSQQADLLPQLFTDILVPEAVWNEITTGGQNDIASQQLPNASWVQRVEVGAIASVIASWDLGSGELEVLSLSLKISDCAAIVDDTAR